MGLRLARRAIRYVAGHDFFIRPDCKCVHERFGSDYGGWDVVGQILSRGSIVYSFGVGEDASFDVALIQRFGMDVHAFDPTPRAVDWVRGQTLPLQFKLYEYGLADFDGKMLFSPPENPEHVSHSVLERSLGDAQAISLPVKRLTTIMRELGHSRIDLLKMDIEGAEYSVVEDLGRSEIRPKQLLVEFHHRFPTVGAQKSRDAITKLKSLGYGLFSVSSSGEEYGFLHQMD
ncbi:FkbM family methyltransferase [Mesorhizobium sp.]|uniref:FkbM family methyltransferase n=1 Tax=Mesorhizobium sp. TaxID=1871066 RepID=UPI000FE7B075|nr:FkbM family methyltransferase [Mesorhizobium sp.]RWO92684.1 MAG: FkbM family methyltransferase [Mesorhizobium sp.]